jgi:hypothetical protein
MAVLSPLLLGGNMHTRNSVLAGLVNGIIRFQGHPEERNLLARSLSATMGRYLDDIAQGRNEYDKMFQEATGDQPQTPPPGDFPVLTGNPDIDSIAIAQWMGVKESERVAADYNIDTDQVFAGTDEENNARVFGDVSDATIISELPQEPAPSIDDVQQ